MVINFESKQMKKSMGLNEVSSLLSALYDSSQTGPCTKVFIDYEDGLMPIEEIRIETVGDEVAVIIR